MKKILLITPTFFSPHSVMGGAERYVDELAAELAKKAKVTVLSFAEENQSYTKNGVNYIIARPLNSMKNPVFFPFREIWKADIIHIHQIYYLISEISFFISKFFFKKVYMTDHGGGAWHFLGRFNYFSSLDRILAVSEYSRQKYMNSRAIFGGVDTNYFSRDSFDNFIPKKIVSLGRILPHKGFHHLIKALKSESLVIIGRVGDDDYYKDLLDLAKTKDVVFLHNISDEDLVSTLMMAQVASFPSTNIDHHQNKLSGEPELLGIAPLECMSLGIPTLVSNIGAYTEIDAIGLSYQHDDIESLRKSLDKLLELTPGQKYRDFVCQKYTWRETARRCLEQYD